MRFSLPLANLVLAFSGLALAAPHARRENNGTAQPYTGDITIHSSCNATERRQLRKAIDDTYNIANVARKHILQKGVNDTLYKKYFGDGDYLAAIGAYDSLIFTNKSGVVFRCDDVDGNCHQDGWAGHWRGSNATSETVICHLSYEVRKPLEQFCALGYTVAGSSPSYYFATDLIHRLFHVPIFSNAKVDHYADSYEEVLELAAHNGTYAPYNTHTLQYFAADAYGHDIAVPGVGCTGEPQEEVDHPPAPSSSASASSSSSTTATSAPTATTATGTSSAALSCHTHADGEVHCV